MSLLRSSVRRPVVALTALTLLLLATAPAAAAEVEMSEQDKTLYALGMMISRNLGPFNLTAAEVDLVTRGLKESLTGADTHGIDPAAYQQQVQSLAQERASAAAAVEKEKAKDFLAKEAAREGAVQTETGLIYTSTKEGEGDSPQPSDRVKVHYRGTLPDGTLFDSSIDRGEPATFALNQVIPCWTEGVQRMKPGGKATLVCPSDIAYGDRGAGSLIKPGAALKFEVELLEIVKQ